MLRRSVKKPRLRMWDRVISSALAMRLPRATWAALILRPETVPGLAPRPGSSPMGNLWSPRGPGRPRMAEECQHLILQLTKDNPRWGCMRIRGDQQKDPAGALKALAVKLASAL